MLHIQLRQAIGALITATVDLKDHGMMLSCLPNLKMTIDLDGQTDRIMCGLRLFNDLAQRLLNRP